MYSSLPPDSPGLDAVDHDASFPASSSSLSSSASSPPSSSSSSTTSLPPSSSFSSHKSGLLSTFQNLVKPFIGAGILALPHAFSQGGIISSSLLMIFLALLATHCIHTLLLCVERVNQEGYVPKKELGIFIVRVKEDEENGGGHGHGGGRRKKKKEEMGVNDANINISDSVNTNGNNFNTFTDSSSPSTLPIPLSPSSSAPLSPCPPLRPFPLSSTPPYRDIGYLSIGPIGLYLTDFNLIASQLGFCIAYVSFISQNMNDMIGEISIPLWIIILFFIWSIMTQIRDISMLAFASMMGNLVYIISIISIMYDGVKYQQENINDNDNNSISNTLSLFDITGLPFVFGTASFALEGIGLILPVKRACRYPSKFNSILHAAVCVVSVLYVLFGAMGYYFYRGNIHSNITKNLHDGPLKFIVMISLSLSLLFSYIIQMYPVTEISDGVIERVGEKLMRRWRGGKEKDQSNEYSPLDKSNENDNNINTVDVYSMDEKIHREDRAESTDGESGGNGNSLPLRQQKIRSPLPSKRNDLLENLPPSPPSPLSPTLLLLLQSAFRIVLVLFTCLISYLFPNFGIIIAFVGSFANSMIAFILPQIFYMGMIVIPEWRERKRRMGERMEMEGEGEMEMMGRWRRWGRLHKEFFVPIAVTTFGVIASIAGVTLAVKEAIGGGDS